MNVLRYFLWTLTAMLGVGFLTVLGVAVYRTVRLVYDDFYTRLMQWKRDKLVLQGQTQRNQLDAIREIKPDENGLYPLLYNGGIIRDANSLRSFTLETVIERYPQLENLDAMHRLYVAMQNVNPAMVSQVSETLQPAQDVLQVTTLSELTARYHFRPRLHSILIGETIQDGVAKPLTLDLPKSVHVVLSGASGLGKSNLCEAMMLELVKCQDVKLCAVDYGSGSFDALQEHLAYQIADTPQLAIALFKELLHVLNQRKEAYKTVQRAKSLDQYNAMSGENLPFLCCFVDETSALLDHNETKSSLVELARVGRKYGLGLVLAGTDFKATTLPTEARGNCQARVSFWLEDPLSRSLFGSSIASELEGVGEIVCRLPGVTGYIKAKTPLVTEADYAGLPNRKGEAKILTPATTDVQTIDDIDNESLGKEKRIRILKEAGFSYTAIAKQIFKYGNSYYIGKVKEALAE